MPVSQTFKLPALHGVSTSHVVALLSHLPVRLPAMPSVAGWQRGDADSGTTARCITDWWHAARRDGPVGEAASSKRTAERVLGAGARSSARSSATAAKAACGDRARSPRNDAQRNAPGHVVCYGLGRSNSRNTAPFPRQSSRQAWTSAFAHSDTSRIAGSSTTRAHLTGRRVSLPSYHVGGWTAKHRKAKRARVFRGWRGSECSRHGPQ